jgi:hypothetical protein
MDLYKVCRLTIELNPPMASPAFFDAYFRQRKAPTGAERDAPKTREIVILRLTNPIIVKKVADWQIVTTNSAALTEPTTI